MIHTSILTSPGEGIRLDKEIRLIKVGLLYSDKITLISPVATMLLSIMYLSQMHEDEKIQFVKEVGPNLDPNFDIKSIDSALSFIDKIKIKRRKNRKDIIALKKYEKVLREINDSFYKVATNVYDESDFEQIVPLIESGKVEFKHMDLGSDKHDIGEMMMKEIVDILSNGNHYPIFDDLVSSIAHQYSIEEEFKFRQENAREVEFGKDLIFRLSNIDGIDFDDITALKGELDEELSNFKNSILLYSKDISSFPYSPESKVEIARKYEYEIKPQILELQGRIKRNKFVRKFTDETLSNASKYVTEVGVFLGVCALLDFEKMLSLSGMLLQSSYKSMKQMTIEREKIKNHPLFFYHEMSKIK